MDTFAYDTDRVTIGTTFAFNGRCATTTENIGTASGSCVVISGDDNDQTVCDFYLQLSGSYGYGPIALSGSTTSSEAHMEITGAAGDFPNEGYALVDFDPAGYAVMYMYLMFTD